MELDNNNITNELNMETNSEVHERARNKAFSKIVMLELDISQLKEDLMTQNTGCISMEDLTMVYLGTRKELKTWNYIATLIEKDE